ncbi:U1 small nuclear ribonucleoprotein 70 kDa homolog [[Candida] railenensis]|uniref:U1 small nuclear ribonucleoprotein 70 kDa homolog n=1 Tax=[Candida] railenensis TaxID=45579 RepID=A0A9P0VYN0_9ASCO|nr:U1 small nuclear ribonucleoprotein 70 kDa homolog [[Candida] railenensis]
MTDNTSKYPSNIQKLFTPKLPLSYKRPLDFPVEERRTHYITPISSFKAQLGEYVKEDLTLAASGASAQRPPTTQQLNTQRRKENQQAHKESLKRQQRDWDDAELLAQNEKEFSMKDPYRTIFVSRLPYAVTELEISKSFSKYGIIESIRITRDKITGKSRGYGFIVYERESDAKNCIRELAPVGLRMEAEGGKETNSKSRIVLVDIERGRLSRSWKPRRLGGGLGGRHYTKPNALSSSNASAAASGRRLHLSSNPYSGGGNAGGSSRPYQSRTNNRDGYGTQSGAGGYDSYGSGYPAAPVSTLSHPPVPNPAAATAAAAAQVPAAAPYSYTSRSSESRSAESVRDKYVSRSDRSIRNIRNG